MNISMNYDNLGLEREFVKYLDSTFNGDLFPIIPKPNGYCAGERVLYKLKNKNEINRLDNTTDKESLIDMISDTLGDNKPKSIEIQTAVATNNIEPRLIDFPESNIIFNRPLLRYFQSESNLPTTDFNIEWMIGVCFAGSQKKLVHIDMSHPIVKGIFSVPYEIEMDLTVSPQKTNKSFKNYIQKFKSLCKNAEKGEILIEWIKLVQIDNELMINHRRR